MNVAVLRNQLPREKWAERISTAWQKQVTDIFAVGSLLEAAKSELKHGEWSTMIKNELPFKKSTSAALMKIAKSDPLRNVQRVGHLPAHWGTLADLTLLTEEQFNHGIESGIINPKMQRKDVKALRGEEPKPRTEKEPNTDLHEQCRSRLRSVVMKHIDKIPSKGWTRLIAEMRDEIDSIEIIVEKRMGDEDGHHTAC